MIFCSISIVQNHMQVTAPLPHELAYSHWKLIMLYSSWQMHINPAAAEATILSLFQSPHPYKACQFILGAEVDAIMIMLCPLHPDSGTNYLTWLFPGPWNESVILLDGFGGETIWSFRLKMCVCREFSGGRC